MLSLIAAALVAGPVLPAEPAKPSEFQGRRALLRRLGEQQQLRLQQQQRCIDQARNPADLDRCSSTFAPTWHHGLGGWGCPMW